MDLEPECQKKVVERLLQGEELREEKKYPLKLSSQK
tara:strand:- start:1995 stop:2102 length:108 start_codon:yes stop_codon:yes gene_type:complete